MLVPKKTPHLYFLRISALKFKRLWFKAAKSILPQLEILEAFFSSGISACPENAIDKVKNIADLCLCHCDNGFIAALIDRLGEKEV